MAKGIVYDTETGGLNPTKHSLLTAYFCIVDENFQVLDSLSIKLKPTDGTYQVTKRALSVNKIDLASHDLSAIYPESAYRTLTSFLKRHSKDGTEKLIPIGKNLGFDDGFIQNHILNAGLSGLDAKETWEIYVSYNKFDIDGLVQALRWKKSIPDSVGTSLSKLAHFFGIDPRGAHDAQIDVELTIDVLKAMLNFVLGGF